MFDVLQYNMQILNDQVRISEIMEAPNIAQEENKKLRHIVVYTQRKGKSFEKTMRS